MLNFANEKSHKNYTNTYEVYDDWHFDLGGNTFAFICFELIASSVTNGKCIWGYYWKRQVKLNDNSIDSNTIKVCGVNIQNTKNQFQSIVPLTSIPY